MQPLLEAELCPLPPVHSGLGWSHQERLAADKVSLFHGLLGSLGRLGGLSYFSLPRAGPGLVGLVVLVWGLVRGPSSLLPSDGDPGWSRLALGGRRRPLLRCPVRRPRLGPPGLPPGLRSLTI